MSSEVKQLVHSVIQRVAVGPDRGRDISCDEAEQLMQAILDGQVDEVQTAVVLIALRMKRESVDEMRGLFRGLQAKVTPVHVNVDQLLCLADPFDGYVRCLPMTPFIPAVLAACGLANCMSGVEQVGPKFGVTAHQVLSLAGIACDQKGERVAQAIEQLGWGYLGQQVYASSLNALSELRTRIVKRTALTTLERVLNPLRANSRSHLVLGYVHKAYPEIYSSVAKEAGFASTLLIKGVEGGLAPALNKPLRQHFSDYSDSGSELVRTQSELPHSEQADTAAVMVKKGATATAAATLEQGIAALDGQPGTARQSLTMAAAHIVWRYQGQASLATAVDKVRHCLDNGSALKRFNAARTLR